ncbi:uncharacterized protein LOC126703659 isoform X6 [Quercus robur]|uniref:uncharacterized protein LOC126703659 isoform X6 n=1 Tax=Quercus robur TaxID=38942 RepID=UPI0021639946|nr:uncharacterized protein LOC126703659 isoform X6 [Quercus robur]
MAGRLTELELERDNSFSFKAAAKKAVELISKALAYILSFSFKAAATKVVELISKALAYILSDDAEALGFYEAFHTVLAFLVMLLVALIEYCSSRSSSTRTASFVPTTLSSDTLRSPPAFNLLSTLSNQSKDRRLAKIDVAVPGFLVGPPSKETQDIVLTAQQVAEII